MQNIPSSELTQEQRLTVQKWFDEKMAGGVIGKCGMCGSRSWTLVEHELRWNYGDTCNNPLTPNQVHCCFGFGPRFSGASLSPVLASISANHALDPTGRPTLSALRNAA